MNALSWRLIHYDRLLPNPILTAHGRYERRQGVLLRVTDGQGRFGLGDTAPLPGFSPETLRDVDALWGQVESRLSTISLPSSPDDLTVCVESLAGLCRRCPSLLFGVETALADLASRRAGRALARWLASPTLAAIPINALVGGEDDGKTIGAQARVRWAEGFRTFKIKVGTRPVAEDVARVFALRDALPDAHIRLDANAAWTEEQFATVCHSLADVSVEFIEQPLAVGQLGAASRIASTHGIALALDEEVSDVTQGVEILAARRCDVLILKPMIVGGLTGCLRLAEAARKVDVGIVFTSSWESDVGLAATLHLAAAAGVATRACGLATAGMIAPDLVAPSLQIEEGRLKVPDRSGLGVDLVPSLRDPSLEQAG